VSGPTVGDGRGGKAPFVAHPKVAEAAVVGLATFDSRVRAFIATYFPLIESGDSPEAMSLRKTEFARQKKKKKLNFKN